MNELQQINSIEEIIAILETRINVSLEDLAAIHSGTEINTDEELKSIVNYNKLIVNYLETLLNK